MTFDQEMRQQTFRFAGGRDPAVIVDPNSWLANKVWTLLSDVGFNYYANTRGNEDMTGGVRFPDRHFTCMALGQCVPLVTSLPAIINLCTWSETHIGCILHTNMCSQARRSPYSANPLFSIFSWFMRRIRSYTRSILKLFLVLM